MNKLSFKQGQIVNKKEVIDKKEIHKRQIEKKETSKVDNVAHPLFFFYFSGKNCKVKGALKSNILYLLFISYKCLY